MSDEEEPITEQEEETTTDLDKTMELEASSDEEVEPELTIEEDENELTIEDDENEPEPEQLTIEEDEENEEETDSPPEPPQWSTPTATPTDNDSSANTFASKTDENVLAPKPPPAGLPSTPSQPKELPSLPKRRPLTVDEDLAEWVQEYLQYRGFNNTLDCFQAEYLSRQYAVTSSQAARVSNSSSSKSEGSKSDAASSSSSNSNSSSSKETRESVVIRSRRDKLNSILTCFDTGDSEGFTKLWYTHIPLYVRQEDSRIQKAYFLARVQLLARCWALETDHSDKSNGAGSPMAGSPKKNRKRSNMLQREMNRFREYLENEGGDIAGTDRTLERYPALLYVGNPKKHPSFTELFSGLGPVVRDVRKPGVQGGNRWTLDVREEIASVVDDTLQHVPAPRLLQMYDAFMTSYASFDVQLRQRRYQNEQSRLLSKKLYCLGVKMARDINDDSVPKEQNEKRIYISNIKRELKNCRQKITTVTLSTSKETNSNDPISTDSDFLLGQPPSLDYEKVRVVIDNNDNIDTSCVLDSLWWRMSKIQPPSLQTGMIPDQKMILLRKDLRRKITLDLTDGDFLCLRKTVQPDGGGGLSSLSSILSLNPGTLESRQVAMLRVLDSLSGWSFGREYLNLHRDGNLIGLSNEIWNCLMNDVQIKENIDSSSNVMQFIGRRHGLSCLQRLSCETEVADNISKMDNSIEILSKILEMKGLDTGTCRFTTALLLNVLVAAQRTASMASMKTNTIRDVAESLCTVMEKPSTTEGGNDKFGRRYASSALYAMCSTIHIRAAINDAEFGGRVAARLKSILQKNALQKENKMFCHEIKHVLLRLETEEKEIPPIAKNKKNTVEDVDEDWYSESEDFLDDSKYTGVVLGTGGPEAAAKARSESLLRSVRFSKRNRIIAPKSSDLLNIDRKAEPFGEVGLIGREDDNEGGVVMDAEGGAEI